MVRILATEIFQVNFFTPSFEKMVIYSLSIVHVDLLKNISINNVGSNRICSRKPQLQCTKYLKRDHLEMCYCISSFGGKWGPINVDGEQGAGQILPKNKWQN
jgi:hypothetical protein